MQSETNRDIVIISLKKICSTSQCIVFHPKEYLKTALWHTTDKKSQRTANYKGILGKWVYSQLVAIFLSLRD